MSRGSANRSLFSPARLEQENELGRSRRRGAHCRRALQRGRLISAPGTDRRRSRMQMRWPSLALSLSLSMGGQRVAAAAAPKLVARGPTRCAATRCLQTRCNSRFDLAIVRSGTGRRLLARGDILLANRELRAFVDQLGRREEQLEQLAQDKRAQVGRCCCHRRRCRQTQWRNETTWPNRAAGRLSDSVVFGGRLQLSSLTRRPPLPLPT